MSRKQYLNDMITFQKKYLPNSPTINDSNNDLCSMYLIRENEILLKILSDYIDKNDQAFIDNFLAIYKQYALAILTKNSSQVLFLTRMNAELTLKFVLLLNDEERNSKSLDKESFRFLKNDIKKLRIASEDQLKMILTIESYFSEISDLIHVKNSKVETFEYLSDQITKKGVITDKIRNAFSSFNKAICILFYRFANVSFGRLGSNDREKIRMNFKPKKIKKLKKWLAG